MAQKFGLQAYEIKTELVMDGKLAKEGTGLLGSWVGGVADGFVHGQSQLTKEAAARLEDRIRLVPRRHPPPLRSPRPPPMLVSVCLAPAPDVAEWVGDASVDRDRMRAIMQLPVRLPSACSSRRKKSDTSRLEPALHSPVLCWSRGVCRFLLPSTPHDLGKKIWNDDAKLWPLGG